MASIFLIPICWIFHWTVILPCFFIVATPYILVASLFSGMTFFSSVKSYYRRLFLAFVDFWGKIGYLIDITP